MLSLVKLLRFIDALSFKKRYSQVYNDPKVSNIYFKKRYSTSL